MFVNVIKSHRYVVAICDKELIGKKFEEGNRQLNVKENFYKGEEADKEKAVQLMKDLQREDATFNIIGQKATQAAVEAKIISEEEIDEIQKVPFTLILM